MSQADRQPQPDAVTDANRSAGEQFNGGPEREAAEKPEDAKTVSDANLAAGREFNSGEEHLDIGDRVGGLRGSSD